MQTQRQVAQRRSAPGSLSTHTPAARTTSEHLRLHLWCAQEEEQEDRVSVAQLCTALHATLCSTSEAATCAVGRLEPPEDVHNQRPTYTLVFTVHLKALPQATPSTFPQPSWNSQPAGSQGSLQLAGWQPQFDTQTKPGKTQRPDLEVALERSGLCSVAGMVDDNGMPLCFRDFKTQAAMGLSTQQV